MTQRHIYKDRWLKENELGQQFRKPISPAIVK